MAMSSSRHDVAVTPREFVESGDKKQQVEDKNILVEGQYVRYTNSGGSVPLNAFSANKTPGGILYTAVAGGMAVGNGFIL